MGDLRVGLFLSGESDSERSLTVEWEAGFYQAAGWVLALYHCDEDEPFCRRNIGTGYRGSVVLTPEILGTDPAGAPLKFLFTPDVERAYLE